MRRLLFAIAAPPLFTLGVAFVSIGLPLLCEMFPVCTALTALVGLWALLTYVIYHGPK